MRGVEVGEIIWCCCCCITTIAYNLVWSWWIGYGFRRYQSDCLIHSMFICNLRTLNLYDPVSGTFVRSLERSGNVASVGVSSLMNQNGFMFLIRWWAWIKGETTEELCKTLGRVCSYRSNPPKQRIKYIKFEWKFYVRVENVKSWLSRLG